MFGSGASTFHKKHPLCRCTQQCTGAVHTRHSESGQLCVGEGGTTTIAFHWHLLYTAIEQLGQCEKWWTIWSTHIKLYDRDETHTTAQLASLGFLHTHFVQATMDFLQLTAFDFASAMQCQCPQGCTGIVADGITVSCKVNNLHMSAPFTPSPESKQLWQGSTFQERIYVPNSKVRALLRTLVSADTQFELPYDQWDALAELLNENGQHGPLEKILVLTCPESRSGAHVSSECVRPLLHALSTNVPACVIIRPAQVDVVKRFVAERAWASQADEIQAHKYLPALYPLMRSAHMRPGKQLMNQVVICLAGIVEV